MKEIQLSNWRFHYNDCPDAWFKGYQEDAWEEVTVPHDWSVHMPFSREYSSGTGYVAGGTGWYRTSFWLPREWEGKRIFVIFDGVYKNSQVWCNSYYMGKRPYGYSTFRYDITEQACFGEKANVIAVRADHRDIADSRWFTGSGLVRKVTVTAEAPIHPEFQGIYVKTPEATEELAELEIDHSIQNDSDQEVTVTVESLLAYKGVRVLKLQSQVQLSAGTGTTVRTGGQLTNPRLWSPEQPDLYQLTTRISATAKETDFSSSMETVQKVGVRGVEFHPDKGFFLNGKSYKLKGVCIHHDAGCLGAAVTPEVWLRRLEYLKEMGCNAVRMSHNPHMPELYDLCDHLGFFVIDEAFDEWEGPKNKWSAGHNVYPPKHQGYYEEFPVWHEQDLADLIKRDRNHPSIIAWSIGNEIDYPNDPYCHPLFKSMEGNNDKNKPQTEMRYNPGKPNAERLSVLAKHLTDIVKCHDLTRPVTAAVAFPELSARIGYFDSFDIVGYNYKEQFYAQDHKTFPEKPFLGSENSHSLKAWKAVRDQEYISGQFLWTGIDYLGEARGWPIHGSGAGILTLAGFPKTSYYRRKSFWACEPVLYLVTARADSAESGRLSEPDNQEWKTMYRSWNYVFGECIEVRCYTNLPSAELYCNGKNLGSRAYDDELGYIEWFVPYEAGELSVIGQVKATGQGQVIGRIGTQIADSIASTGRSCDIRLKNWTSSLQSLPDYLPADNCTLTQIEVTVTDEEGRWVTNDSTMLFVQVSGPGRLAGLENGDLADVTEYSAAYRRAYEGRLLIYAARTEGAGEIKVTVSGAGLRTAELTC